MRFVAGLWEVPPCTIRLCLGELMSFWGKDFYFPRICFWNLFFLYL
ncbi:hypothetical protein HMPREF9442_01718 [Paraprevotella xylaniphila YIT 11841]|uniref:Uncharacterized protein n=1 Tax=Paraprevotella xylaniphila YIT 11841 TaxID=762982 RepID=F3QU47_9BACT|nr:hypothetical protein HMPREF9442_01718 [Paraprevotella xylaniphila YIT 11841]